MCRTWPTAHNCVRRPNSPRAAGGTMSIVLVGPKGATVWSLSAAFGQQNAPTLCVNDVQAAISSLARMKVTALVLDPLLCNPKVYGSLVEAQRVWPTCAIIWNGPLPEQAPANGPLSAFQLASLETPAAQARAVGVVLRFARKRSETVGVLVVDDTKTYRALGQSALEKGGFPTIAVASMEEALEALKHVQIGGILTDLFMEGMGGIEGIHHLRQRMPQLAIVAMSSGLEERMQSDKALMAAMRIGADRAVSKPFEPEALADAMREAITAARARPSLATA